MRELQLSNVIKDNIRFAISNLSGAILCKIIAVNEKTIDVQPVINYVFNKIDYEYPIFKAVPILHLMGGETSLVFPIKIDDYCLLIVTTRCFDNWYIGNDFIAPATDRMFSYSDCIAICGLRNKDNELVIPTDNITLNGRLEVINNDFTMTLIDGTLEIVNKSLNIKYDDNGEITITTNGKINITSDGIVAITGTKVELC